MGTGMAGGVSRSRKRYFIGVTGAQGVGKSLFCRKLHSAIATEFSGSSVELLRGLGDQVKARGLSVGSSSDTSTIAAVFAAHLERERNATADIVILDRCVVDAIAYVRALGVTGVAESELYEQVSWMMSRRLDFVVQLRLSEGFKETGGSHETVALRHQIAALIGQIIDEYGLSSVKIDAMQDADVREAFSRIARAAAK